MDVSVVIPVYNAEKYIGQAVQSALDQPETAEIILVEDGSSDDSLTTCLRLAAMHDNVQVYTHPWPRKNRGAAASRNLGIRKSHSQYIAFLDADDYYLANRFAPARRIFEDHPNADGVYDAVQVEYMTEERRENWYIGEMLTLSEPIKPGELFETLILGTKGQFCANGIIVHRRIFGKTGGLFRKQIKVVEDTEMWFRMAAVGQLLPGQIDHPVAIYRIHPANKYLQPRTQVQTLSMKVQVYAVLWRWARWHLPVDRKAFLYRWYFYLSHHLLKAAREEQGILGLVRPMLYLGLLTGPRFLVDQLWGIVKSKRGLSS